LGGNLASPNDEILFHALAFNGKCRETSAKNEGGSVSLGKDK